jgi:hypothetical protein
MDEKIKFHDGYAIRLKRCVNVDDGKIHGLKSHEYHIIMERVLPIMLRGYLDDNI